jgi:ankyrin repeat protein
MGAAYYGRTSCVSLLVKAGGDVNASDPEGLTPLMFAAKLGHTETARLLVSLGANVDATSKNGKTPLAYALEGGHADVVVVLRRAGPNHRNRVGQRRNGAVEWGTENAAPSR